MFFFFYSVMQSDYFGISNMKILTLRVIKKNAFKRNTALNNKEIIKLGFSATVVLVCIFELCYKEIKPSL